MLSWMFLRNCASFGSACTGAARVVALATTAATDRSTFIGDPDSEMGWLERSGVAADCGETVGYTGLKLAISDVPFILVRPTRTELVVCVRAGFSWVVVRA